MVSNATGICDAFILSELVSIETRPEAYAHTLTHGTDTKLGRSIDDLKRKASRRSGRRGE
jgi:hypothetical protein